MIEIVKQFKKQLPKGMVSWKPGQSGNPKGRPKKSQCIPDILDKVLRENTPEKLLSIVAKYFPNARQITTLEAVLRAMVIKAIGGDMSAVNFIADRTEGKVRELDTEQKQIDLSELADAIRNSSTRREQ